jgi:WD40 repeat protein
MLIAPDGRLVTGSADHTVRAWNLDAPQTPPAIFRGHEAGVTALAVAPGGRLVTGGGDKLARVWDLGDPATPPLVLRGHLNPISAMAFLPDGRLATGCMDGIARIWSVDLEEFIRQARAAASRNLTVREWEQFFGQVAYRPTFPEKPAGMAEVTSPYMAPRITGWVPIGGSVFLDEGGAVIRGQRTHQRTTQHLLM